MNKIGIVDKNGIPFTPDRFMIEPGLAEEFLEIYETLYYGPEPFEWRDQPQDVMFQHAAYTLHCLEQDLAHADYLRNKNKIQ